MNFFKKIINTFFKKRGPGYYSANQASFFFIFYLIFISLILGKTLESFSLKIENKYLSDIFLSAVKPISDFSSQNGVDSAVPKLRASFLYITGLEKENGWDDFYYIMPETQHTAIAENKTDNADNAVEKEEPSRTASRKNIEEQVLQKVENTEPEKEPAVQIVENEKDKMAIKKNENEAEQTSTDKNIGTVNENAGMAEKSNMAFVNQNEKFLKELLSKKDTSDKTFSTEKNQTGIMDSVLEKKEASGTESIQEDVSAVKLLQPSIKQYNYKYTAENPFRILMVGDSQMQSISGGFKRLVGKDSSINVTEIAVHSSGFIRGDYYNWIKKLESVFKQNKDTPFDAVIIFLGMNDYQNFYDSDGKVLVKETAKWEAAYGDKIKKHLNLLLANTKKVYWLGMPIVRNRVYNEELSYIERVQLKVFSEYQNVNLIKFSMSAEAPGKGVPYTDFIQTPGGKKIKLMRDDGVHYTISGGEYIMHSFLDLLYRHWDIEPINLPDI